MSSSYLVADVGATNARFAIVEDNNYRQLTKQITLPANDYLDLTEAMSAYFKLVGIKAVDGACIAIAGPVHEDSFKLANNHWQVNKHDVQNVLSCDVLWLNDFAAQALAVSAIDKSECLIIQDGKEIVEGNKLIIGPGSGLGVAGLVFQGGRPVVVVGEGGHASFAPGNKREIELLSHLLDKFEHVSIERLASGSGIPVLYEALSQILKLPQKHNNAADITADALKNNDPLSVKTMDLFFGILGQAVASSALQFGALGGVYLVGGILPKLKSQLLESDFVERFVRRGRLGNYLKDMPIYLCLNESLGIEGAALALRHHLE